MRDRGDDPAAFAAGVLHGHNECPRLDLTIRRPHLRIHGQRLFGFPAFRLFPLPAEIHNLELLNHAVGARLEDDRSKAREDGRVAHARGFEEILEDLLFG